MLWSRQALLYPKSVSVEEIGLDSITILKEREKKRLKNKPVEMPVTLLTPAPLPFQMPPWYQYAAPPPPPPPQYYAQPPP